MSFSVWINRLLLISLMLISLSVVLVLGKANLQQNSSNPSNADVDPAAWSPAKVQLQAANEQEDDFQDFSKSLTKTSPTPKVESKNQQAEKLKNSPTPSVNQASTNKSVSTKKQAEQLKNISQYSFKTTKAFKQYTPSYEIALANPSNYGERFTTDINGVPVNNLAIIVIHETSDSASSAINTFQTPHTDEKKQVSYHSLITLDGTILYIVPPDKRAFGAGNSVFDGSNGPETVQTNPGLEPSVNNFAYHVSLETPPEGRNNEPYHIGYTDAQYYSLAWLIAQSSVPDERITTHRAVDRSGTRIDPRSFDFDKFFNLLHSFRQRIS